MEKTTIRTKKESSRVKKPSCKSKNEMGNSWNVGSDAKITGWSDIKWIPLASRTRWSHLSHLPD